MSCGCGRVPAPARDAATWHGPCHSRRRSGLTPSRWSSRSRAARRRPASATGPTPRALGVVGADASVPEGAVVVVDAPDPDRLATGITPGRLVVFDDSERFAGEAAMVVQPSAPAWAGRARAGMVLAGYRWAPIGAAWRRVVGLAETTRVGEPAPARLFRRQRPARRDRAAGRSARRRPALGDHGRRRPGLWRRH